MKPQPGRGRGRGRGHGGHDAPPSGVRRASAGPGIPAVLADPRLRFALLAAAVLLFLVGLGVVDASAPDEPRYLQVAEELRAMERGPGDLILLHLNGEPYTQKPPLYYWMAAAAGALRGRVTEGAGRLPSALAGIATVWLTLVLGSRLFGRHVGVLGAGMLLTVYSFAHLGRRVQLDVLLAGFELSALVAFWWLDRGLGPRRRLQALLHLSMGLAVLTKGPVGLLIPGLTIVAFLGWERRWRDVGRVFPWWGWLLSAGPGLAWIAAATALAPGGFFGDAVGTNLLGRFFAGTSHERPFYYFFYQFPADFLPWTLLWPLVYLAGRRIFAAGSDASDELRRAWRFLLAGVAVSFVFFSLSSGKRGLYMVPVLPATALLTADATLRWLAGRATVPRAFSVAAAALAALLSIAGLGVVMVGLGEPLMLSPDLLEELNRGRLLAFGISVVVILGLATAGWAALHRRRAHPATLPVLLVGAVYGILLAGFTMLFPALDDVTSVRSIAVAAASRTAPGDAVGLLGHRAMVGGLAYYAERPVAELQTSDDVRSFVEAGGAAIVLKRRKLDRVGLPVEVVASAHAGRRELVVVVPVEHPAERASAEAEGAP